MATPVRRSGRERKANPKYEDAGWDKTALRLIRDSSQSSGSSPPDTSAIEAEEEDDDFDTRPNELHQDETSTSESHHYSDASSASTVHTPLESDHDLVSVSSNEAHTPGTSRKKQGHLPAAAGTLPKTSAAGRSRGINSGHIGNFSKHVVFPKLFGPDVIDLKPALRLRDTWLNARDITLPSRATLAEQSSISQSETRALDIPAASPSDLFSNSQVLTVLNEQSVKDGSYLLTPPAEQSIALGAVARQKSFKLNHLQPLDVSEAWTEAATLHPDFGEDTPKPDSDHRGWLLSLGEKPQCLAWLPDNDRVSQQLALATRCSKNQRSAVTSKAPARSPAFHPSPSYPTSIQLWCVTGVEDAADRPRPRAILSRPRLQAIYAIDAGDIRQLLWQPSAQSASTRALAVLSTDGFVRLISLPTIHDDDLPTKHVRIQTPAMQLSAPQYSIFTSMSWASATDLILGDSAGTIRIYNLLDADHSKPYLTREIHHTYIMNVVSTFPSDIPTFIASTSASGEILLTDLRAPNQDGAQVVKARVPTKPLVYSHLIRAFLSIYDTSGMTDPRGSASSLVVCHHLRDFHYNVQIARLPRMSGTGTALAASPQHPCILIGNAKGSVFTTNYARRALPVKGKKVGLFGGYLQQLFEYDWRPATKANKSWSDMEATRADSTAKSDIDIFHGHDVRPGISRFIEGFSPNQIDLTSGGVKNPNHRKHESHEGEESNATGSNAPKGKKEQAKETAADVVYEEEQAVTCLEWNPNQRFAGWAVMGWGSGIVRMMDLSHDAE